ncbi:MAG: L-histidine N(alpha)-methyltransferase [Maribacter sp.]
MSKISTHKLTSDFGIEVRQGLTNFPKHLSSKYFYDKVGDELFQDIMAMPEYYLTDAEFNILEEHKEEIGKLFSEGSETFNLIELGAGDGKKTKIILKELSDTQIDFTYLPIDISQNALDQLTQTIENELPTVHTKALQGTYFETLSTFNEFNYTKKIILFLGSNIGNLLHEQAINFLRSVQEIMLEDDLLFLGVDQKKHPQSILDAYNDPTGITEAFNKNILVRINNELGGDFNTDNFLHWEVYDPETGTAKSYLVSKQAQEVTIEKLSLKVNFKPWETIHTEISQKYDDEIMEWLAQESGLRVKTEFSDDLNQFKNYVLKKK